MVNVYRSSIVNRTCNLRSANAEDYIANKVRTLLEELQGITDDTEVLEGMVAVF